MSSLTSDGSMRTDGAGRLTEDVATERHHGKVSVLKKSGLYIFVRLKVVWTCEHSLLSAFL